jgi:hypothetical protein
MVQANGDMVGIRAVILREYEALEDEEPREASRAFQVIHPFGPGGSIGTPFRDHCMRCVGVSQLQG